MGSRGTKSPHKIFRILAKILSTQIYNLFCFNTGVSMVLTFCKNNMFQKNLVLELWSKNLKANQNAGFSKLEYLTNKLKLNFWIWLERSMNTTNVSWLLQVGVVRHAWICPKWWQIVSQLCLKNELSYEVFCMW